MTAPDDPAAPPRDASPDQEARRRRLAEALRENLKRRKAQTRSRRTPADSAPSPGRPDDDEATA